MKSDKILIGVAFAFVLIAFVYFVVAQVVLLTPTNNVYSNNLTQTFTCNVNISGTVNNVTLYVWNSTGSIVNTDSDMFGDSKYYCYQETANQSTAGDGNCGLNYSGTYNFENNSGSTTTGYFYINYSKPNNSLNSSLWQVKHGGSVPPSNILSYNISFSNGYNASSCWSAYQDKLSLRIISGDGNGMIHTYSQPQCYNGSNWLNIGNYTYNTLSSGCSSGGNETELWDGNWTTNAFQCDGYWADMVTDVVGSAIYEEAIIWNTTTYGLTSTLPYDNSYKWNCLANNGSNVWASSNSTLTTDTVNPQINFTSPTATSSYQSSRGIMVNVTSTDTNLKNITIYLFNSSMALINSTNSTTSPLYINFSVNIDGIYYFNATSYDLAGNSNSTETRNVTVDITNPNATLLTPLNNTHSLTKSQNFTANLTDNIGLKNATLNIYATISENNNEDIASDPLTSLLWAGQGFTIGEEGSAVAYNLSDKNISLRLARDSMFPPEIAYLNIYLADAAGKPTGAVLSYGSSNLSSLSNFPTFEWRNFTMSSYELSPNTKYVMVLNFTQQRTYWRYGDNDYNGGDSISSTDAGVSWTVYPEYDYAFKIEGTSLANQTTTTYSGETNTIIGTVVTLVNGIFNWFYSLFDLAGNSYTTNNNTLTLSTINVNQNNTNVNVTSVPTTQTFTINLSDSLNTLVQPINVTIWIWNSTGSEIYNSTQTYVNTTDSITFSYTFTDYGTYSWDFLVNDSSNTYSPDSNYTISIIQNALTINLINLSTSDIFSSAVVNVNVSTGTSSNISYCNFTLANPSGNVIISNYKNTTSSTALNLILSSNSTILNQSGNWNASVTCINSINLATTSSQLINVSDYTLTTNPPTNSTYSFLALVSVTELNGFNISIYDSTTGPVTYIITSNIQDSGNFTTTVQSSVLLNSTDNSSNQLIISFTLNASAGIANGTYTGNVNFTNSTYGLSYSIPFSYGISPPAGIPTFYSSDMATVCTDALASSCSVVQLIYTGSSYSMNYSLNNTGGFTLTNCSANYSNTLNKNWITYSLSNFSLTVGELKNLTVTFTPTSPGTFWGNLFISCSQGNIMGSPQTTTSSNRPFGWLNVLVPAVTPTSGGGGGAAEETNLSLLLQGFCGNNVCDGNETLLTCPNDCTGQTRAITDCFEYNPFGDDWNNEANQCLFKKSTTLLWIFLFLVAIFVYSIFYNPKENGSKFKFLPDFITNKLKRRRR